LVNVNVDDLSIKDIAHALSNICRFTGHGKFYSVAQHSVLVSQTCDDRDQLWGLLHDSSEAVYNDLSSPLKRTPNLAGYRELEEKFMKAICRKYDMHSYMPNSVKNADEVLFSTEVRDVLYTRNIDMKTLAEPLKNKIYPVYPEIAKEMFLDRFFEITGINTSKN
jgi:5'-deoxynucleotidase YfbR-like HD superfamily hydrolase